jgi:hypothetical protein
VGGGVSVEAFDESKRETRETARSRTAGSGSDRSRSIRVDFFDRPAALPVVKSAPGTPRALPGTRRWSSDARTTTYFLLGSVARVTSVAAP